MKVLLFASSEAGFFCLGVSSVGMSEAAYTRLTFDLTLAAAAAMVAVNPRLTFCYVSGLGTDSSEQGRTMWARVKGRTENALLAHLGRALIQAAAVGYPKRILALRDINALGAPEPSRPAYV
jgi:hypothetical protein